MKKSLWILLLMATLIIVFFFTTSVKKKEAEVIIGDRKFKVELVKNSFEQQKGLSGRKSLDADTGMLFLFSKSDIHTFWMKNTLIPLDIIWLNDDKIVEMTTLDAQNGNNIPKYTPKNRANYVLELNAGTIQKYNFQLGNLVEINL